AGGRSAGGHVCAGGASEVDVQRVPPRAGNWWAGACVSRGQIPYEGGAWTPPRFPPCDRRGACLRGCGPTAGGPLGHFTQKLVADVVFDPTSIPSHRLLEYRTCDTARVLP